MREKWRRWQMHMQIQNTKLYSCACGRNVVVNIFFLIFTRVEYSHNFIIKVRVNNWKRMQCSSASSLAVTTHAAWRCVWCRRISKEINIIIRAPLSFSHTIRNRRTWLCERGAWLIAWCAPPKERYVFYIPAFRDCLLIHTLNCNNFW